MYVFLTYSYRRFLIQNRHKGNFQSRGALFVFHSPRGFAAASLLWSRFRSSTIK